MRTDSFLPLLSATCELKAFAEIWGLVESAEALSHAIEAFEEEVSRMPSLDMMLRALPVQFGLRQPDEQMMAELDQKPLFQYSQVNPPQSNAPNQPSIRLAWNAPVRS